MDRSNIDNMPEDNIDDLNFDELNARALSQPMVTHMYTADPSAHAFAGKVYIYPSHDIEGNVPFDDLGSHFSMEDYHVLSMDDPGGKAIDEGIALHVDEIPWAERQLWAPDAAEKEGMYYLFFPAKDYDGIFRIGVATSTSPTGPFKAEPQPISNSFSIDPAVFKDDDGSYYLYFGGIWGGQLQRWRNGYYEATGAAPFAHLPADDAPALCAKIAKLSGDLLSFAEVPKNVLILDEKDDVLLQGDTTRRFFEASWMHRYNGEYYFSYSTGDSHLICYATASNPYGPFRYRGVILNPVVGWTTHHSVLEWNGKYFLFYHDSSLSKGITHLRSVKVAELQHNQDGSITAIDPYRNLST